MSSDALVADQTDHPGEPVAVTAAGALPWRVTNDRLEVLLIHRPRYDDWSWPKGKIDDGETIPECALREVREEIGLDAPLGRPLPAIHYRVASGLKVVFYWAVKANGTRLVPDGKEVDSVMWCAPEKAAKLLSNPTDVVPLEYLRKAHEEGELNTWPLVSSGMPKRSHARPGPKPKVNARWPPPAPGRHRRWDGCCRYGSPRAWSPVPGSGAWRLLHPMRKWQAQRFGWRKPSRNTATTAARRRPRPSSRPSSISSGRWWSAPTAPRCRRSSRSWRSTCPAGWAACCPRRSHISPPANWWSAMWRPGQRTGWSPSSSSSRSTTDPAGIQEADKQPR
ncbi:ADP-ribose pyrophosphatase [Arthrobacter nitrophenolicus]|uniref:ADP-ribose pyrophosphatase n=1 Tax=Arthrobacter nitrophenolicus TaxID=683150 RepID=L8TTY0_9MICC|nr:ADP-ribose pyrophosphatase [Arthrobacter nitrophenolicus]